VVDVRDIGCIGMAGLDPVDGNEARRWVLAWLAADPWLSGRERPAN
jgi:hypothetical protein